MSNGKHEYKPKLDIYVPFIQEPTMAYKALMQGIIQNRGRCVPSFKHKVQKSKGTKTKLKRLWHQISLMLLKTSGRWKPRFLIDSEYISFEVYYRLTQQIPIMYGAKPGWWIYCLFLSSGCR